jgi:carbamoyltransferase
MNILGITHCISWNSAACLLMDGELISMNEEERFIRKKHALEDGHSAFPKNAINECLNHGKISISNIDLVCIGW